MISDILSPILIFCWIILGILSFLALLGNGFITAVIGHQWLQKGKIAPCDFLLSALSTSRFLVQLISVLGYPVYFNISWSDVYYYTLQVMNFTWSFFAIVNLWSATWLSIFYCVKVTNFPNRLFFWLKTRINVLAPRLLAMSVAVSTIVSLPSFLSHFENRKWCNLTEIHPVNNCPKSIDFFSPLLLAFTVINFSLNVLASLLLLTSLWRHTRNLRKNGAALKDLSTHVHIKVMKFLLFYLFLYILYFTGMVLGTANIFEFGTPGRLVTEILLSVFSSAHSTILILTHPKLKKTLLFAF
nr:taste receptor type 2 member 41-like [Pogona vitticeps]